MTPRRLKFSTLGAGLLFSALVFLAWTQDWVAVTLTEGAQLNVAGDVASPALSALALTSLVLIGALSIAGPVFRVILGVLQVLLGATMALASALAIADPVRAATPVVTDATGIAGAESVAAMVATAAVTAWPWLAVVASTLFGLAGIAVVATARRWPGQSGKYSAVRMEQAEGRNAVDDWDALSDGTDPT